MKNRFNLFYLPFLFIFLLRTEIILPQAGTLDTTFGQGGIVTIPFNIDSVDNRAESAVIQSDGKIVVAGSLFHSLYGVNVFLLSRYNSDGTPDMTFGTNGIVTSRIEKSECRALAVALQMDGKIVVAGYVDKPGGHDFAIVRYNPDGSPDNTFGANGIVTTSIGDSDDSPRSMLIQEDGKIVVAGQTVISGRLDIAIARYLGNGFLDNSFGANGIVTKSVNEFDEVLSLAMQGDGKLVVGGATFATTNYDFFLARFNASGSADNSFGENGVVVTPLGIYSDFITSVAVQKDGKIIAAGDFFNGNDYDFAVARYQPDGKIDSSYALNGVAIKSIGGGYDNTVSAELQDDGKLIVAGHSENGDNTEVALVRFNQDGVPDETFGTDSIVTLPVGPSGVSASSVSVQDDGKIVITANSNNKGDTDIALVRLQESGELDHAFGSEGIIITPIAIERNRARSMAVQADGKIIVAGTADYTDDSQLLTARYHSGGSLDTTFGNNGTMIVSMPVSDVYMNSVNIQSDGKIVTAGYANTSMRYDFTVIRCNADGRPDSLFGTGGIVTTQIGTANSFASSSAVQTDGKIVVAGECYSGDNADIALARYNTDGSPDSTFGTGGILVAQVDTIYDGASDVSVQQDGKIVVCAISETDDGYALVLARYQENGLADHTFGKEGIFSIPVRMRFEGVGLPSMTIQDDGKIIAGGNIFDGNDYDFWLVRVNTDGSIDNTFGENGIVTTDIESGSQDFINSIAIQGEGNHASIIVSGFTYIEEYENSDFSTAKYNMDGSLDADFDEDGIAITSVGSSRNIACSVVVQDDGKAIVAGTSSDHNNYSVFTLIRYNTNPETETTPVTNEVLHRPSILEQNYPNPFESITLIRWHLTSETRVSLKIYDSLGNEISTLVDDTFPAGDHETYFNAEGLAGGIYYYSLTAGNLGTQTKQMILIR